MSMREQVFLSPAKLNLFLHITAQRTDGYHELQTIFQFIDYYDELSFYCRQDQLILRDYGDFSLAENEDLIVRAVFALLDYAWENKLLDKNFNYGLDIGLNKKIPLGGGLGGGSSNAATTLVALNQLWALKLNQQQLMKIGRKLGADVPIFIYGKNAWAEGIGEQLIEVDLSPVWYLVIKPDVHVSTSELFADPRLNRQQKRVNMDDFLQGDVMNVFEPLVCQKYPRIKDAILFLSHYTKARMTGTGACVFGLFDDEASCLKVLEVLPESFSAFIAKGTSKSVLYQ